MHRKFLNGFYGFSEEIFLDYTSRKPKAMRFRILKFFKHSKPKYRKTFRVRVRCQFSLTVARQHQCILFWKFLFFFAFFVEFRFMFDFMGLGSPTFSETPLRKSHLRLWKPAAALYIYYWTGLPKNCEFFNETHEVLFLKCFTRICSRSFINFRISHEHEMDESWLARLRVASRLCLGVKRS